MAPASRPAAGRGEPGLSLDLLERHPHGIDLGPLKPRIPEMLRTPSGKVELCPEPILADLDRLGGSMAPRNGQIVLIGRRHLRSNNSWMHNLPHLVRGKARCTMHVSPADAERLGLADGGEAPGHLARRLARRPGRGDRRDHGRRRLDPARLGPRRRRRSRLEVATRARGRQLQPPRRRDPARRALRATPSSTASRSRSSPPERRLLRQAGRYSVPLAVSEHALARPSALIDHRGHPLEAARVRELHARRAALLEEPGLDRHRAAAAGAPRGRPARSPRARPRGP